MSEFSDKELRRLDLTLLLVFLGLLKHRKAAAVARDLGLTQSAISQALKRLRDILGDELFLRRSHGMDPTAVALALEAPVTQAVEQLRGLMGTAQAFVPETATGTVRLAALDAEQAVLVPELAKIFANRAPGLRLSVIALARGAAVTALEEGRADIALGFLWDEPDTIFGRRLYEEGFLVAGVPDAIPDAPEIDLDTYCAAEHVLVSPGGDLRGIVDEELAALGRRRRVVLGLPAFLSALAAVRHSGALVTLPARVARTFAKEFGLSIAEPPIEIRRFPVSAYWHRRNDSAPQTRWLIEQIADCSQEIC